MNHELKRMVRDVRRNGLEKHFKRLHHFARRDKFDEEPFTLRQFDHYCEEKAIREENTQTIRRAQAAADAVGRRMSVETAIDLAWRDYPVVTR